VLIFEQNDSGAWKIADRAYILSKTGVALACNAGQLPAGDQAPIPGLRKAYLEDRSRGEGAKAPATSFASVASNPLFVAV